MSSHPELETRLWDIYRKVLPRFSFDRLFARARLKMLPLDRIDACIPRCGTIVEIGCGHGLITNYLALASEERTVVGLDIDRHRIALAHKTVRERKNIHFQEGIFRDLHFKNVDVVILFGVLCLIPFGEWSELFASIHRSLNDTGTVLLHDVKKERSLVYWLHEKKEDFFRIAGITKGAGFFVKEPHELEDFLQKSHFQTVPLTLDAAYHSCLNYLLTKAS